MLSLNIDNPIVENFYRGECNDNKNKFINTLVHYIEVYTIKQSVEKGLEEAKLQATGHLEKRELKSILDEL